MPAHPSSRERSQRRRIGTPGVLAVELVVGAACLGLASLAGLVFAHRPWPDRLDVWGFRALPMDLHSRWAHDSVMLGSRAFLIAGVTVVLLIGIRSDWVRALACALAPLVAVLIAQEAKPLVGRHLGFDGPSSYPSGTVVAVAALATALTLVAPMILRPAMAVVGAGATACAVAAVIVLRWHYPTDALGGVGVGVGAVLIVDGLAQVPRLVMARLRSLRSEPGPTPQRQPQPA